ncbi:transglycosylase domain-containing protein [Streptomyces sp. BV129]|nr:transglycosylase domain-containing protein [Streptomyces sp. BV129]
MSDEPQPQQPNEGGAPNEPLPAEGPAAARPQAEPAKSPADRKSAQAGKPPESAPARDSATPNTPRPSGPSVTGGKPDAAPAKKADGPAGAKGTPAAKDAGKPARSGQAPAVPTPRADRSGQAQGGSGAARTAGKSGAEQTPAVESTQVLRRVKAPTGAAKPPAGGGKPPVGGGNSPVGGGKPPVGGGNPAVGGGKPPVGGGKPEQAPESTQVLRRVKADRPPAAESTQVLRRVNAPRSGDTSRPGGSGDAPKPTPAPATATPAAAATTVLPRTPSEPTATPQASGSGSGDGGSGDGGGKKPKRPKRTGWRRMFPTWRMVLGTVVLGAMVIIGLLFLGYSMVQIPAANALATKQATVYLYADGSQLARDGEINRENVGLAQISKGAQHAILAAEDRDFYTESAVDPKAMLRAGWNTALGKGKQSGSTITQQYVKNYYLAQEQTVSRKAKEFFISIKLDREKSKNEILEGYLNTSYFGRNAYGIQAAAQAYYGRDAIDLDPARAAYLAALVNAPSEYDVVAHPENKGAALGRWNYVLDGMVSKGWLAQSERTGIKFPMPKEQTVSTGMSGQRGYLVEAVKDYLVGHDILTKDQLTAGGYRITTTIQKPKQDAFVKAVDDQLIAKLDKKNRKADTYVRAGGASIDPKTGKIVAMYGGIDYVQQYTNGATRGDFQVGSTFKPFVFTSAVQNASSTQDGQRITPNTYYDGTNKRAVQGWTGGAYAPENEDQRSYGKITIRKATDLSVNSVYAQMAADVTGAKVKETAIDLGVPADTPDLYPSPSIALGTATASVLEMTEAYATLANHGRHGTYTIIEKISKDNVPVDLPGRQTKQAVSREAADTTTSVLKSVVEGGTATAAQAAGRPAAGKTGTAEEDTAAWFAGYTPDLATVVSVMGQDPVTARHKPLYGALGVARMNGGGPPTEIWAQYTRNALRGKPAAGFDLELQAGADVVAPSTLPSTSPGTDAGQENAGATGTPSQGTTPADGGQDNAGTTGTPTQGTTPADPTTTGGAATTDGTTGGPATDGGATGGGLPGGQPGGGGDATGGGADPGTTGLPGGFVAPQTTTRRQ